MILALRVPEEWSRNAELKVDLMMTRTRMGCKHMSNGRDRERSRMYSGGGMLGTVDQQKSR